VEAVKHAKFCLAELDGVLAASCSTPSSRSRRSSAFVSLAMAYTQSLKARLSLFSDADESDSCRTMEVRHVSTDTVAPGF
jgi:hypothetical protein